MRQKLSRLFFMSTLASSLVSSLLLATQARAQTPFALPPIPASKTPLWNSYDTLPVRIEANFKELFSKYKSLAVKAGRQSSDDERAYVDGKLIYKDAAGKDVVVDLRLRARGHSSLQDCDFPKLDLEFTGSRKDTLFDKTKRIKVGTHCSDVEGISGNYGRLRNQLAPHREAMAYRLLEVLGVKSLKARAAVVTYVSNDAPENDANREVLRNAFFLESIGEAEQRYQARQLFEKNSAESALDIEKAKAKGEEVTDFFTHGLDRANVNEAIMTSLGNIFLSNFDTMISWQPGATSWGRALWNMKSFLRKDGTTFVMPFDFDLAAIVNAPCNTHYCEMYLPTVRDAAFKDYPENVKAAKAHVLSKADELKAIVDQTDFSYPEVGTGAVKQDENGRSETKAYVDAILKAIDTGL